MVSIAVFRHVRRLVKNILGNHVTFAHGMTLTYIDDHAIAVADVGIPW